MLKRCKSIWPYYRPSENGEGKKKAIHHSNILLEPALSITIYIFLSTCNCSVQKRLFPFIFSFKLSKTDEVTETPDPTTTYNPPFIVFVFLLTKNTLLDFFYFSPEAASIGVVDRVFGNMIAWVWILDTFNMVALDKSRILVWSCMAGNVRSEWHNAYLQWIQSLLHASWRREEPFFFFFLREEPLSLSGSFGR